MRSSLRHLSDSRRNDLTLVVRHIRDAFRNTRASGKVFGLGRKLRRAADLADPEMIVLFGAHLRRAVDEYMEHYHLERTHQGLGNQLIDGVPECCAGRLHRHARLGGLLNSYYREAG